MSSARLFAAALLAAALLGTQLAAAQAGYTERLPRVKPGPLLPSAGGLVLGKTTKPQVLARWGPASQCVDIVRSCSWIVGIARNGSRRPGVTADYITVVFHDTARWARDLSMVTSSARKSRLRGWRLPGGIGIGSGFPAVRRAHPTLRWLRSTARNTSTWGVASYQHQANHYTLQLTFDRATKDVSSGRVLSLNLIWQPPLVTCALALEAVPPPEGAAAGRRIRGSCQGAAVHSEFWGRPVLLPVRFVATGGGHVLSATSPFDPNCSDDTCHARPSDWAIDVTVGLSAANARLEARVGPPATSSQVLRIPLG